MTTLTTAQLDELEDAAGAARGLGLPTVHYSCASPAVLLRLVAIARAALAWRAQITTLSLAAGLPQQVWAELCRLDSEMAAVLRGEP